jgi:hypothetical protein
MKHSGANAALLELFTHSVRAMARSAKHDCGRESPQYRSCGVEPCLPRHAPPEMLDIEDGLVADSLGGGDHRRVRLIALSQLGDLRVQRGRKEQCLAALWGFIQQGQHLGQEAHVGKTVCLIHYRQLHLTEPEHPSIDQVTQPARTPNGNVDPRSERVDLALCAGAAIKGIDNEADGICQQAELFGDLFREFASR